MEKLLNRRFKFTEVDSSEKGEVDLLHQAAASESLADASNTTGNRDKAIKLAIKSAELYLKARNNTQCPEEKKRLEKKCNIVLKRAERWKSEAVSEVEKSLDPVPLAGGGGGRGRGEGRRGPKRMRELTIKEQTLLWKSSRIGCRSFPPWTSDPKPSEFLGDHTYLDNHGLLCLSPSQSAVLETWKRPHEITTGNIMSTPTDTLDLTQDLITDCSVVASLCSAVRREELGFGKTVSHILYPQSPLGAPVPSQSGKYIAKLFINGTWRKVTIDDLLPTSATRSLYVTTRNQPDCLLYALVEKAYLEVMGGYDFPGSNSGTDLLALTGWIPEHVFLQSDDFVPSALWKRVKNAWGTGDVMITLGTGRLTGAEEELGLIGEHDYAVLSLKEENGERLLLVKNPWTEGTTWRGVDGSLSSPTNDDPALQPGTFWIPLSQIIHNFSSFYLNWNPSLFSHLSEHHFSWDLATKISEKSFAKNPQFTLSNPTDVTGAPVWVLLSRHIGLCREKDGGEEERETSGPAYIALYLFEGGDRVNLSSTPYMERTTYVDSPNTLLRLDTLPPNIPYTLVVSSSGLPPVEQTFSMHVYSLHQVTVKPPEEPFPYQLPLSSSWTRSTGGGPPSASSFPSNPQFLLTIPNRAATVSLLLESSSPHPLNVILAHTPVNARGRISSVTSRDIVAQSGEYTRGATMTPSRDLPSGRYTAVVSTFEPQQLGSFSLTLLTTAHDATFELLKGETAGRFETVREGEWDGRSKVVLGLEVERFMGIWVKARSKKGREALRVSIKKKDGGKMVAQSGDGWFEDKIMGVRTGEVDLRAGVGGYEIVLERNGKGEGSEWEVVVVSAGTVWVGVDEGEGGEDGEESGSGGE